MRKFEVSPSFVISVVALFVALGGGAYAALGPHSVGTTQLKPGAVTSRILHGHAVNGSKIRAGAVRARHIKAHSIPPGKLSGQIPGTVVAYAKVTPKGVDATESWGMSNANVTQMPLGSYCFTNLPEHRFEIVSGAFDGNGAVSVNLAHRAIGNCALVDEDSVEVATSSTIGQTPPQWRHEPFYIYLVK